MCQVGGVNPKLLKVGRWLVGLVLVSMIFAIGNPHNYPMSDGIDPIPNVPGAKGVCPEFPPEGLYGGDFRTRAF